MGKEWKNETGEGEERFKGSPRFSVERNWGFLPLLGNTISCHLLLPYPLAHTVPNTLCALAHLILSMSVRYGVLFLSLGK